jgi:hypothetical protein
MVRRNLAAKAIALEATSTVEDSVLEAVDAAINDVSIFLSSLVLVVVRLIISGRVAVGGFARS